MFSLSNILSGISKNLRWLWNSPTFTTWGNYGIQSLRLLLVTPLILTRFDETEIAAWYLFASLNFFGTIISQRLGLTFSRMFAFAMGGASNLAPIKGAREQENEGQPNWSVFERAYGTIGSLNFGIAWLNVLIALGMGWFGLNNLLEGYEAKATIWLAFAIMQATSLLGFIYQRYSIALQGMNYVALSNRWNIVFGILSVAAGSITLYLSENLVLLVIVMQAITLLSLVRVWMLLRIVEEGRVARMKGYAFDREVFRWAWEPSWKGFTINFCGPGLLQIVAVLIAKNFDPKIVAGYLFSVRMIDTINVITYAPFSSIMPALSRLKSTGSIASYNRRFLGSATLVIILLAISLSIFYPLCLFAIGKIGSDLVLVSASTWSMICLLRIMQRLLNFVIVDEEVGNNIITVWHRIVSFSIALLTFSLYEFNDPKYYYIWATLPFIIISAPSLLSRASQKLDNFSKPLLGIALFLLALTSYCMLAAFSNIRY